MHLIKMLLIQLYLYSIVRNVINCVSFHILAHFNAVVNNYVMLY